MILFIDTDVLIDTALERKPFVEASAEVLDYLQINPGIGYMAWHTISNFYYLVSSGRGKTKTKDFITELCHFVKIAPTSVRDLQFALSLPLPDFEDAMQAAAAVACHADWIVTRNIKHYKNSPVPAVTPKTLIKKTI